MVGCGIDIGFRNLLERKSTLLESTDHLSAGFCGHQDVVREVRGDKED